MKKLIYIANVRIPTEKAHGIQIMQMLNTFANFQLEIELIVPRRLNSIKQDPFEYYGVNKNFKITKLPTLDLISFRFGKIGFFIETIIFLVFAKIYLLNKHYSFFYTREEWAGLFFKNFSLEVHSLPSHPRFLNKLTWQQARAIFVLTSFLKQELVGYGIPENKICILPDAVDLEKFDLNISQKDARHKLNLPFDKKIAVYTGQLFNWKGVEIIIEVGAILESQNLEIYVVGGNFSQQKKNNVCFVGQKPYSEIPLWLKAADVLILPNKKGTKISEEHTSPLKLFEYMASRRPIVASDLPSIREILTENEAIFFNPDDAHDLAYAIKNILWNQKLAEEISEASFLKVENYTWDKRAKRALDFISDTEYK